MPPFWLWINIYNDEKCYEVINQVNPENVFILEKKLILKHSFQKDCRLWLLPKTRWEIEMKSV